jgi:hypothetical protein
MKTENKRLFRLLLASNGLLLIPLIAMQFTEEVNWDAADFVVMGILLSSTALLVEFTLRIVKQTKYRILLCGAFVLAFLLIWVELAVGIFNSPIAGS